MFRKQSPEKCTHATVKFTDRFWNSELNAEFSLPLPAEVGSNEYLGSEAKLLCPNSNSTSTELSNKRPKSRKAAKKSLTKIATQSVCDGCVFFDMTEEEYAQVEVAKNAAFIARLKAEVQPPKLGPKPQNVVDFAYKVVQAHTEQGIEDIEDFANQSDFEEDDTED